MKFEVIGSLPAYMTKRLPDLYEIQYVEIIILESQTILFSSHIDGWHGLQPPVSLQTGITPAQVDSIWVDYKKVEEYH